MLAAFDGDQDQRAAARREVVDEVVEHGVLAALHRGGRADHHQPDEQEARHLLEPVEAGRARVAQHHLQEHRGRHHREDEAAEVAERVVEVRERGLAVRAGAVSPLPVRHGTTWCSRIRSTILRASLPAAVA